MSIYVVTGSESGIGAAVTAHLEREGSRVIGVDRAQTAAVVADLSTRAGRVAAATEILAQLAGEPIAGLVLCAGIGGFTGVDPELVVSINYFGSIELLEGLTGSLDRGSAVVLISSNSTTCQPGWPTDLVDTLLSGDEAAAVAAVTGLDAVQVYPITKSAVATWARQHVVEYMKSGVRLNTVAPGMIATPMVDELRSDPVLGVFADAFVNAVERPGKPDEVASVITFLLSPAAAHVVGAVLFVDGGTDAMLNPGAPSRP